MYRYLVHFVLLLTAFGSVGFFTLACTPATPKPPPTPLRVPTIAAATIAAQSLTSTPIPRTATHTRAIPSATLTRVPRTPTLTRVPPTLSPVPTKTELRHAAAKGIIQLTI